MLVDLEVNLINPDDLSTRTRHEGFYRLDETLKSMLRDGQIAYYELGSNLGINADFYIIPKKIDIAVPIFAAMGRADWIDIAEQNDGVPIIDAMDKQSKLRSVEDLSTAVLKKISAYTSTGFKRK